MHVAAIVEDQCCPLIILIRWSALDFWVVELKVYRWFNVFMTLTFSKYLTKITTDILSRNSISICAFSRFET